MATGKWFVLLAVAAIAINAGEFRTRFNRAESVTLVIPRPADAVVHAKSLAVLFKNGQSTFRRSVELTQLVQGTLAKEFDVANAKPQATLEISVIAYEPVVMSKETKMELRMINAGTSSNPNYQNRSVPVVYLLAHGSITGSIYMSDTAGKVLDSYQPVAKIDKVEELTVNGQAPQTAPAQQSILHPMDLWRKPSQAGRQKAQAQPVIETAEGLETTMLQSVASEIGRRYIASSDSVDIFLAVDQELRLGDKLAESGQWKEALASWTAADMKKNPADRTYNMAVAKEALAYADYAREMNLDEFLPQFEAAMDMYTNALHADPSEKYMQEAVERLQLAKTNIEATRRIKVEQDAVAARAAQQAIQNAQKQRLLAVALADKSPDTPDEASFRADVRTELSSVNGDVTDAKRDELVAFGERMKLPELRSYRVVSQEIERKKNIGQALADYERVFRPLVADGKMTPAKRAQLKDLARREDLSAADVKSIESKYHFQEISTGASSKTRHVRSPSGTSTTAALQ